MSLRYNVREEVGERFYRLPKVFFTSERYKKISNDAKIAYAILQDRMDLSIKNGWVDEIGNIYFVYGNDDLANLLNVGKNTVIKIKKELNHERLLEQTRMGQGKRNRLYLLKPIVEESDVYKIQNAGSDGAVRKFKKQTSNSVKNKLPEVQNLHSKRYCKNETYKNDIYKEESKVLTEQLKEEKKRLLAELDKRKPGRMGRE